jgi:predicted dehydrogenase
MSKHRTLSRREFLRAAGRTSLGLGAGLALPNLFLNRTRAATGQNPSDLIRVGFIGVGGQGTSNLRAMIKNAAAVCDVDKTHVAAAKAAVEKANGGTCATYSDYRKMLEDKSLDAVCVGTPDHWHALPSIHACEAGKDVYCEKPLTLTIQEGRVLASVAQRTKRIVQTGSQQRSDEKFLKAAEYVRNGRLGKIKRVLVGLTGVNYAERAKPLQVPDSEPPAELDYDFWLGPAPWRPYNKHRVHYLFRFFWDYSGGQMTNWGAHHLDIAQWALGMDESGPVRIEGKGFFNKVGPYDYAGFLDVRYGYRNGVEVVCENEGGNGVRFHGTGGSIFVTRMALEASDPEILRAPVTGTDTAGYDERNRNEEIPGTDDHHNNWLDCIRSRQKCAADIETGHRSATLCHLGNIAMRLGRPLQWDPEREEFPGDATANVLKGKPFRAPWRL